MTPLHQVLYVMELHQDQEKGRASFTAVSEFLLTHPVLSFGVHDVTPSRQRHTEVLPAEEESESMTTGTHNNQHTSSSSVHGVHTLLPKLFYHTIKMSCHLAVLITLII